MDIEIYNSIIGIIVKAGREIINIYNNVQTEVEYKKDKSPLTAADTASHFIIESGLKKLKVEGEILPLLSEEGKEILFKQRKSWQKFWLIDPLDGTKEFIKRNGEFTVNIALVDNNKPIAGFVYIPVKDVLFFAGEEIGSFVLYSVSELPCSDYLLNASILKPDGLGDIVKVVASRSHLTPETEEYINKIRDRFNNVEIVSSGSSIKLCMIADCSADVYPRFAPTMEWDTAAAHAVCRYAGVKVIDVETRNELAYNKENLRNPWFLVYKNEDFMAFVNQ